MKYAKLINNDQQSDAIDWELANTMVIYYSQEYEGGEWVDILGSYQFIDLGLPSGNLWCEHNLGVRMLDIQEDPEHTEYNGCKFKWGELSRSFDDNWSSYKFGTDTALTKYVMEADAEDYGADGFYDNKFTLDPEDDVARKVLGNDCKIPTFDDIIELKQNTNATPGQYHSTPGYILTSKINGNTLFIPDNQAKVSDIMTAHGILMSSTLGHEDNGRSISYGIHSIMTNVGGQDFYGDDFYTRFWYRRNYSAPIRAIKVTNPVVNANAN